MKREKTMEMFQSAVRLPKNLHDQLKKAGGERGMGEEIRRRLEASFQAEKDHADPTTRELLDAISAMAEEIKDYYGPWSEDSFAFEVLKACVNMLWAYYQPKGEPTANPNPDSAADLLYGPDHSPKDVSRTIVNGWINDRAKRSFAQREKTR
jgi:hypothetical protein